MGTLEEKCFKVELENFKNEFKNIYDNKSFDKQIELSLKHALTDALNGAARRKEGRYGDISNYIVGAIKEDFRNFLLSEPMNEEKYERLFSDLVEKFNNLIKHRFHRPGYSYKFVSMAFKYLYCLEIDDKEEKFKYCYMPIDDYTLQWYNKIVRGSNIKNWCDINETQYFNIQTNIKNNLKKATYNIGFKKQMIISLPKNRLKAEFIIWNQEKLKKIYPQIIKNRECFGLRGIVITED